ncbi:MAG: MBL fold metallo-hydrolase [Chlorobi bacterium]|nr:MAG: MBL fold metallo-hydrolase [Bacteroidota bacterium]MBE2266083.1 MBL fold metallo-hydrolase [Flavobacteriales bacterium]MBL1160655.1 MBL fold metallo-hydrolase [Chlorobiota bacterium]MBW7853006.1 MBL fold metallo-hydrolase [Candidatus Kapabacteria bacterium]MCC6331505.1 MBL fold metallo-hydrolase [Ignavibacteria bacterium]
MYQVTTLETCRFGLDGGAMFGVVPKPLWERVYAKADERNRIPMAARCLLLQGNGKTILVDTGNSTEMPPKLLDIYGIDFSEYSLKGALALQGIRPEDVTDVILTHLHFDHSGGAVIHGEPAFPNARYYVQKHHLEWARNPSVKDRASFESYMYEPLAVHGVLELLDGPGTLFDGVDLELFHGHTPFMQSVIIQTTDGTLFYPADLFPTAAHIPVAYGMAYDNQPLVTVQEKQTIHSRIIDENWTIVFEHDAFVSHARLRMGPKGPIIVTVDNA